MSINDGPADPTPRGFQTGDRRPFDKRKLRAQLIGQLVSTYTVTIFSTLFLVLIDASFCIVIVATPASPAIVGSAFEDVPIAPPLSSRAQQATFFGHAGVTKRSIAPLVLQLYRD